MSMLSIAGVRTVDALYRVSTIAQETEGESMFNQRRTVELWAKSNGVTIRNSIEVTESGKSALQLAGRGFIFSRRSEYADLIVQYQKQDPSGRPDAVVIDWTDRWSRNVVEYALLIETFSKLGIRLLAIGDGLDLTDPRNHLVAHVRAAIGQEQLRIIREKVCENRRSRRERGKWQGGSAPDGFRTHERSCSGLVQKRVEKPDGRIDMVSIRACGCDVTRLQRDPAREQVISFVWHLFERSPLSFEGMAEKVNARGFRRPNGLPFRSTDLYRIGENPHYAGVMVTDRWERDAYDQTIKRRRPLSEQGLVRETGSIPEPYVSEDIFWALYHKRYNHQTRYVRRAKNGSVSELTGILVCPQCDRQMSSFYGISSMKTGHGNPRRSPRKKYVYMRCSKAQGPDPACGNRQRVRVDGLSTMLVGHLARIATLSDDAINEALEIQKASAPNAALVEERMRLSKGASTAEQTRHHLTQLYVSGALTKSEVEAELFAHKADRNAVAARIAEIDRELSRARAPADHQRVRSVVSWLMEHWQLMNVEERAEALRVLVDKVTYLENGTVYPDLIRVISYGAAFVEQVSSVAAIRSDLHHTG